jgi:hypothetical protein
MRRLTVLLAVVMLAVSSLLTPMVAAQEATPRATPGEALDLAAMALTPDEVPPGLFDDYYEWWVPAAAFSELVLGGAAMPDGLQRVYQSFYFSREGGRGIYAYLFEYTTAEAAASGFDLVNVDVLHPPIPPATITGPTATTGPALGDETSTLTQVSYDARAEEGPLVDVVAATFRRDRLIAGVAVERWTDPIDAGTPEVAATAHPADAELAEELARVLEARVTTVLEAGIPSGVDPALAAQVLPLDQVAAGSPVFGGYKAGIDLLRCGICGEENTLLPFAEEALGGFVRITTPRPFVDGEPQPPFVSVAVTEFTSSAVALEVLETIRQAPNERPTPGPIPRGERTLVADPVIPGASAALGFEAIMHPDDPEATVDSAGVDFVVGSYLVTVDVQEGLDGEAALALAVDLATQQSACLSAGGSCTEVTMLEGILN